MLSELVIAQAKERVMQRYAVQIAEEVSKEADVILETMRPTDKAVFQVAVDLARLAPDKHIQRIKILRTAFGLGLKHAKYLNDAARAYLGAQIGMDGLLVNDLSPEAKVMHDEMIRELGSSF